MSKLLSIIILGVFMLSLVPPIAMAAPIAVAGTQRKMFSGGTEDFYHVAETNNYIGIVAMNVKGNHRGDIYFMTIDKATGNVVFNGTFATDNGKAPYLASNGTHFLIAYAEYDGSNYHLKLTVHDGSAVKATVDVSDDVSSLPDSAGLYPVAVWMSSAESWIIGWYDNDHGDKLHIAIYNKAMGFVQSWDSSYGGARNNRKYFAGAFYDPGSGKAVLVGRAKGDNGNSYGIYIATVSWDGSSFTINEGFLTNTGSVSEGSDKPYYYNARGPVAALCSGKLLIVYELNYKNPQPLKYMLYDVASGSVVASGEIESSDNIAGSDYNEGAQPRVAAGNGYFVVTYTTNNDKVYAAAISASDGSLVGKTMITDKGEHKRSWAWAVYNGTKYTFIILYPYLDGTQIDLYAVRFNASSLQTGDSVAVRTESYNETKPVAIYVDGKIWFAYRGGSVDVYDLADSDVPELPVAPAAPSLLPGQLSDKPYDARGFKMVEIGGKYIAVWVEETDTSHYVGDLYFAVIDKATGAYEHGPTKIIGGVQDRRRVGSSVYGGTPQLVAAGSVAYVVYVNGTGGYDVGIAELHTDGTFSIVYNYTAAGYQELVSAAYDPGHGKLAVFLLDRGYARILVFGTAGFSVAANITLGPGGYYKYFHNDIIYANGYFVAAYLNRSHSEGGTYLAIVDAASGGLVVLRQIGGLPADCSGQGPSIAYLAGADRFLVAYVNDDDGKAHVFATMFNLTATGGIDTAVDLVIDNVTDTTKYPYVVAGDESWLVTWEKRSGSNDVYGAIVLTDATVLGTLGLGIDSAVDEGYARVAWEPSLNEWIVVYGYDTSGASPEIHGIRVNKSAYIGTPTTILSYAGASLSPATLLSLGNGTEIMGYYNKTDNTDPWYRFFDAAALPAPSRAGYIRRSRILIQSYVDSSGDGVVYVADGETIHVEAQLQYYDVVDKQWKNAAYGNQEITVKISRITYYGDATYTEVYTTTVYTDANGHISIDIDPDSFTEKLSTVYSLYLSYPGNDTVNLHGSTNYTSKWTGFLPIVYATPAKTIDGSLSDWQTTGVGAPALVYKNGELIVTDPSGDLRNDATYKGVEESDVDLTELHMALDNSFLYIAYKVAGSAEATGTIVPALAIAIDFNDNKNDGALAGSNYNLKLWHTYVTSDTRLKEKRGWDILIVLMPAFKPYGSYPGLLTVNTPIVMVYKNGTSGEYIETFAGIMAISGDTVEAAIPLDIIGYWHYNDPAYNPFLSKNITIFNAVFPINTTSGKTYGIPYADFADFAGGVFNSTQGTVPAGMLNQGYMREDYTDKELDFYIVAAIDNTGKFFGYTRVWSINETVYAEHKAYTGLWSYGFRILDHLNPMFGVPGVTVNALFNTTSVSGTTNATGYVFLSYSIDTASAGKPITITVSVSSTDYISLDRTFELTVYVPLKYVDGNVVWSDVNGDGILNTPDQLYMWVKVYTRLSDGTWGPVAGIKVPFIVHSPEYLLGYGTTNSSGIADLTYIVNGTENILGYHDITIDDQGTTDVLGGPITLPGGAHILMVMSPAPEPPVLPLLLLAALLLFIIIKKRK